MRWEEKTMKESQILAWYSSCFSTCLQAFFSICDLACIFRRIFIQIHQTHTLYRDEHASALRTYSKAYGCKIASILPDMHEGVWGLRQPQTVSWNIFHCSNSVTFVFSYNNIFLKKKKMIHPWAVTSLYSG